MTALTARRAKLEDKLADLKASRGAALLDGKPFDNSAIDAAQADLDAIVEAEGEAARRERRLADETRAERIARLTAQYKARPRGITRKSRRREGRTVVGRAHSHGVGAR